MNMADMGATPPWLTALSWVFVVLAVVCAAAVLYDVYGRGHRQRSRPMELVWPLAALSTGPVALALYHRLGRPRSEKWQRERGTSDDGGLTARAATGGLPGGVASAVAHVVGVPLVVASGLTIAGLDLWAMIAVIAVLATALLFAWEYFVSTVPKRGLTSGQGLAVALLVAFVTVLAFDVGMGGWMLLLHFGVEFMPAPSDIAFVFLMQIGVILGFLTGYPAVAWLLSRGTKAAV